MFAQIQATVKVIRKTLLLISVCFVCTACVAAAPNIGLIATAAEVDLDQHLFLAVIKNGLLSAAPDPEQDHTIQEEIGQDVATVGNSTTYYVDCIAGGDARSGRSPSSAWKTMKRANSANLAPGDRLFFKRDCNWIGPLDATWRGTASQPIVIGAYGTGELPRIQDAYAGNVRISGTHLIIENLHTTLSSVPDPDPNCDNQPVGWKLGFAFQAGSSHNIVQHSKASKLAIGVYLENESHHNKVLNNTITDNNVAWELYNTHSMGAMGVMLKGDHHEIAHNDFANNRLICTYTDEIGGISIELYGARNANVHHNQSFNDRVFVELGSNPPYIASDNVFAYNLHVVDSQVNANFLITRGQGSTYGPVWRTSVTNNTVYLTSAGSKAIVCGMCGNDILTLKNNILWADDQPLWSDMHFVKANNIFWSSDESPLVVFRGTSERFDSIRANPQFVDAANGNFQLQKNSPAIDKGLWDTVNVSYDYDLRQTSVPADDKVDIGAFEYRSAPWQRVFAIPGRIEAENYRGYVDTTEQNSGSMYRDDGVDIEATQDSKGAYNVGWIDAGEWLSYQVYVTASGTYRVTARMATPSSGRRFHIEINGHNVSGAVTIPWTGGWQNWVDVPVLIPLTAGRHTLRLVAETDRFNVNYLDISKAQ